MSEPSAPEPSRPQAITGPERVTAFSDGVFAIAVTLLVLDLKLPEPPAHASLDLDAALLELLPRAYTWVLSFVIIGTYWIAHHRMFAYIKRADQTLLWLNIIFLLCISFIPFPTSVLGTYGTERTAVILYFGTLAATGLVGGTLWWYASHGRRLVDAALDSRLVLYTGLRAVVTVVVFLLAVLVALWSPSLAIYCPLLVLPGFAVLERLYRPQEQEAEIAEFGPR